MAKRLVPFPLLWQLVFPRGERLPKRKEFSRQSSLLPRHYQETRTYSTSGQLDETEYRYFHGYNIKTGPMADQAICRWCSMATYGTLSRKNHGASSNCKHMCDVTCEYLRLIKICAICGKSTGIYRWGIPLCGDDCQSLFRFGVSQRWIDARAKVRNLEQGTKVGHATV